MAKPAFDEIKGTVRREVILATNAYTLLTGLAFPMMNQPKLYQHYPFIVQSLYESLSWQVLMTVCRLFDPVRDPRHASLSTFLRRVVEHHRADPNPSHPEWRRDFEAAIPERLGEIEHRWPPLAQHRSAYLAHRDMTKSILPELTFRAIRECFEWAQGVLREYFVAYEDSTHYFDIAGVKNDPQRFLAWCRLDDYERHFAEDMKRWRRRQLVEMRRGAKGKGSAKGGK
jgi:hypothetical protein